MGEYRNIFMSLKNVIVCFFTQNAADIFFFRLLEIGNLFKSCMEKSRSNETEGQDHFRETYTCRILKNEGYCDGVSLGKCFGHKLW
jgi:hypothetical protein